MSTAANETSKRTYSNGEIDQFARTMYMRTLAKVAVIYAKGPLSDRDLEELRVYADVCKAAEGGIDFGDNEEEHYAG